MSKTIGSILQIAGLAALASVAVLSGVGIAGGFTVAQSLSGAIYGLSTALGVSTAIITSAALIGLQSLAGSLSSSPKAETTTTAIKTERPPRFAAYGELKLFGAYILYVTASDGAAVDEWAFHEGRIDAITDWYLGDKKVVRLSNGFVQKGDDGSFGDSNIVQIGANLGAAIETAHAPLIAKLPGIVTPAHRGDGVVTGYQISAAVKTTNFQKTYPSGGPNATPLALVIRAQPVFDWRDPTQSVADPLTWKWSPNSWLHIAHYKLVREAVGPTRPPSHPDYWSDLAALYTARWSRLFAPTVDYWTAAANDADLAVPLRDGSTEPRYRSCVSHRLAGDGSEHRSVLASMLATCDGMLAARHDGALIARAGRYYTPTVSIGPDQIVSYTVESGIEDENALNQLNVTYLSAAHDWNTVDTDAWIDEDDILARGAVRSDDFSPQTPSFSQNRRLAKRKVAQVMAAKRGTFTTLSSADGILGERFVDALFGESIGTPDEFVAYDGPVEITQLSQNLLTGMFSGSWISADTNIDAWNPATEEGNPAPVGERVAREPLETPSIISATPVYTAVGSTPEGDEPIDPTPGQTATGARILIAANGLNREDVTWSGRWRVGTSGSWSEREYADSDPGPAVSFTTEFVPLAANINVEVAYSVGDGRLSDWSNAVVVNTTTN
jgi:hypothetical protein